MSKQSKAVHLSANTFAPFPAKTHSFLIWQELAKCVDDYIVIGRSQTNRTSLTSLGNISLKLLPLIGRSQLFSFFLTPLYLYSLIKEKPDYIICQCPVLGGLAGAIYKFFNKNAILTLEIHGEHIIKPRGKGLKENFEFYFFKSISKFTFTICDNIRTLSPSMTKCIIEVYGKKYQKKIRFLPNRVNTSIFKRRNEQNKYFGTTIKIITVGAFSPIKNHMQLIKDLHSLNIDFHLTIIGSGILLPSYEVLINHLGIRDKVTILQSLTHKELAEEYVKNDVYIHYSLTEGVPRVILEAQACGVPVISTDVGFIKGVLVDKENALIMKSANIDCLNMSLKYLLSDSNYNRIAEAGYINVIEKYDSVTVFRNYRNVIQGKI